MADESTLESQLETQLQDRADRFYDLSREYERQELEGFIGTFYDNDDE